MFRPLETSQLEQRAKNMDEKYQAFNAMTRDEIAYQQHCRSGYEVVIKDLAARVDIFIDQVVREQAMKKHKGHIAYVAKLAAYLTWVLMHNHCQDLVKVLIDKIMTESDIHPEADIDLVAREAAMEEQYVLRMHEKGYKPLSPFDRDVKFNKGGKPREIIRLDKTLAMQQMYN